ncbi:MAG: HAD family hydrolase [Bacteroidetes bacterium]|nr:MAG: HAD family hydrolase [Bacteroidota bacterium]
MSHFEIIAFDADDTLWANEPYFRETEDKFCALLQDFAPAHSVARELLKTEINNLPLYGYGVKGFMLSMVETALKMSNGRAATQVIEKSLQYGKELLEKPIELLDGVEAVLEALYPKYRLVLATKGDLLDQERKLKKSGLMRYFHHIEIMSDKKEADYRKLLTHLDISAAQFLMIGNSVKSDVLPVLAVGGHAIHIPYHTTWEHEVVHHAVEHPQFKSVEHILELLKFL